MTTVSYLGPAGVIEFSDALTDKMDGVLNNVADNALRTLTLGDE